MNTYFELNDKERIDLRSKLSIIFSSYKKYCYLINSDNGGSNYIEIGNIVIEIKPIFENNIEKIIYYGLEFLILCMSKVKNTDIKYVCEFLNYFLNDNVYKKHICKLISKSENNEEITKSEKKYYYYFMIAELMKYKLLQLNYEPISIDKITQYRIILLEGNIEEIPVQIKYNIETNEYIDENMDISYDIIDFLYDHIKNYFPEWSNEIALCKDINFTFGNPLDLYFNGNNYIKK